MRVRNIERQAQKPVPLKEQLLLRKKLLKEQLESVNNALKLIEEEPRLAELMDALSDVNTV